MPVSRQTELIGQAELGDQVEQLGVGVEDDVVAAVEGDPVVLEMRAEAAELSRRLEHDRTVARLGQEVRRSRDRRCRRR